MALILRLPKLAVSMTEATLVEWLVDDGGAVSEGQPLYVLEADKATMEVEAPAAGRLRRGVQAGQTHQVGDELGAIE